MCGFSGYWHASGCVDAAIAGRMATAIAHRGPDDAGVWCDESAGLALSHRRLSILDLSPAGHQPMVSPCGRYVLAYNGEIYNHQELRRELKKTGGAFDWRGHSDTETLLASLRHWGVQGALERINGMFAFALWDVAERTLVLARDRMGEKPLYYGRSGESFLFGSELKALAAHPQWCGEVNRNALALYLRHNYVPAPWSIYQGISKLPPAHFVVIRESGHSVGEPVCYWNLGQVAQQGVAAATGFADAMADELDALLRDAIKRRMTADVPLGAFLSGGYDSTMVAALMQEQSEKPIKTFTIGFHETAYNEATHAKAVAAHLGTDHTELYVTPEDAIAVIPKLPTIYDEPFSDSSQIPTYLVSQLARQHVTVALSGDGGDELFYGYSRYPKAAALCQQMHLIPTPIRKLVSQCAMRMPTGMVELLMDCLPRRMRINQIGTRLPLLAQFLTEPSPERLYQQLVSHWKTPSKVVLSGKEPDTLFLQSERLPPIGISEKFMFLDMLSYLPDDILTKVDRASMAVGLEARVPMLDHRLVEFSWRVPMQYKYRNGQGKWLLRQVLHRYVPQSLMERPKMGFGVPIEHWLRGPLREWAEELLDERRLREEGFFDPAPIRRMWAQHQQAKQGWHYYLWDVLMFQAWRAEQLPVRY